ncbi:DUF3488 and transglutaminase-like domain-containing protein [Arthrobacter sp. H14-L1]|uniref:DUF3488 and transglutaminase-like domain-containing protein n=1 Tax=Arthrobacter sp. H14-L1 TaxID=2996697 RepID=UPI002271E108|nr:transglutaminaseTgpA domain-containing protein [Arthrobacter sp. H14-L1]MCY0904952.1 transglutaminaseTgpA domain-containing protein [Arthrobacter sp. H14-L1]
MSTDTSQRPPSDGAGPRTPRRLPAAAISRPRLSAAPWAMAGAIFVAVVGTSLGLNGVLRGWSWLILVILTVAAVLLTTATARSLRVPQAGAQLLGLLALIAVLTELFFSSSAVLGLFPTKDTLDALGGLLRQASDTIISGAAPVFPDTGVVFVICAGIGLTALLVDALAVALAMPASSGLGLLAIVLIPALIKPDSLGIPGFLGGAAGYLLILGFGQWYAPPGGTDQAATRSTGQFRRAAGLAAAAVVITALAALLVPGFSTGTFPQGSHLNAFGKVSGLNPMLTLGNDLRQPGGAGKLVYATDASSGLYLRTTTLEDFSGRSWEPTVRDATQRLDLSAIGDDKSTNLGGDLLTTITVVESSDFSTPWLPVPYAPASVSGLAGRWSWDPETLAIEGINTTSLQQKYTVRSVMPALTSSVLSQAAQAPPKALDPVFMSLPKDTPDIVRQRTGDVTAGAQTPYEKALAIQNYLRGPQFSYSEQTPVANGYDGSGMDVLAKFLQVKSGYCVHFSAAMAVMARVAGIPSRIAVGYAPGQLTGATVSLGGAQVNEYQVDGHSAHAWPELYFTGLGWVPFEPTPGRGQVPSYARLPGTPGAASGRPDDSLNSGLNVPAPSSGTGSASPTPVVTNASGPPAANAAAPLWLSAAGATLLLLATPLLVRTGKRARRRSTLRTAGPGQIPELAAWAELEELAYDYGMPTATGDTPRTFTARLLRGPLRGGQPNVRLSPEPGPGAGTAGTAISGGPETGPGAVRVLLTAYEQRVYGPAEAAPEEPSAGGADSPAKEPEGTQHPLLEALAVVHRALRAASTPGRRLRAELAPPSALPWNRGSRAANRPPSKPPG